MQPEFLDQDTPYSFQPTGNIFRKNDSKCFLTIPIDITTTMIENGGADTEEEVKPCRLFEN